MATGPSLEIETACPFPTVPVRIEDNSRAPDGRPPVLSGPVAYRGAAAACGKRVRV